MDLLWVRWFGRELGYASGWDTRRLHRLGFIPHDQPDAFGFLDPADVIRGIHLIPAFAHGHDEEWVYYYVNM